MSNISEQNTIIPAKRTREITYAVRDVLLVAEEVKNSGKEMLYLNIGDPVQFDFDVPAELKEAVYRAMLDGHNGYGASQGLPAAIDALYREAERKGICNVQDIFTSYGGSEAIELCLSALADPKDNIILPSPGYPLYSALNAKLNIESRFYRLNEEDNWQPDIEDIEAKIDKRTKAIVIINPNNPTGTLYSRECLLAILEIARRHKLVVFSDEIYDKILFDGRKHIALASLVDDVVIATFGGLSKCYLAPGWRVGWCILSAPKNTATDYVNAIHKMTRARLSINHPIQYAIQPALDGDHAHIQMANRKLQLRRDITQQKIEEIPGLSCVKPQGAFYAFPKIELDIDDESFVKQLIRETGVVVVHGSGFGKLAAKQHFRIVFLPQESVLQKAYENLAAFMKAKAGA